MALKKKRDLRKRVNMPAWLTLDGGFAARPCMVVDQSPNGARIVVDDPGAIRNHFHLAFARGARTGPACEVVWRRGKTLGVKFVR